MRKSGDVKGTIRSDLRYLIASRDVRRHRLISIRYTSWLPCHGRRHIDFQIRLNLDPFMIHETFLYITETAFGSHPCRVVSATYRTLRPFHGSVLRDKLLECRLTVGQLTLLSVLRCSFSCVPTVC
jgi:hypothetical protein